MAAPSTHRRLLWLALQALLLGAYLTLLFAACALHEPRWWSILPLAVPLVFWLGLELGGRVAQGRYMWGVQAALFGSLACALLWILQQRPQWIAPGHVRALYFAQEALLLLLLAALFGRTLLPGRKPLCTTLATLVHKRMTPLLLRYTRQVTLAWAAFMLGLWLVSLALFLGARPATWAFFSAFVVPLAMVALFIVEAVVRKWVLPPEDYVGLAATMQAVRSVRWAQVLRVGHTKAQA